MSLSYSSANLYPGAVAVLDKDGHGDRGMGSMTGTSTNTIILENVRVSDPKVVFDTIVNHSAFAGTNCMFPLSIRLLLTL